jgi:phosphohistidine phosphatase
MHVFLVHHGKAKSVEEDSNRPLSDEGREELGRVGDFLRGLRLTVSLIIHSGKARAEETAHILSSSVRSATGPTHMDDLNPTDDPTATANFLNVYTDDVLIVGHVPHLERLTSVLLTGNLDRRPVQFRNGGVVCLEKAHGTWSLVWAIVPELLKKPTALAA